jgi:hypothetical protein
MYGMLSARCMNLGMNFLMQSEHNPGTGTFFFDGDACRAY